LTRRNIFRVPGGVKNARKLTALQTMARDFRFWSATTSIRTWDSITQQDLCPPPVSFHVYISRIDRFHLRITEMLETVPHSAAFLG